MVQPGQLEWRSLSAGPTRTEDLGLCREGIDTVMFCFRTVLYFLFFVCFGKNFEGEVLILFVFCVILSCQNMLNYLGLEVVQYILMWNNNNGQ